MPEPISRPVTGANGFDVSNVHDPDVRRALTKLHQQVTETLQQQQMEIDAILELMFEKGGGSLSEFKRHLILLQQNRSRGQRIHDVIASVANAPHPTSPVPRIH